MMSEEIVVMYLQAVFMECNQDPLDGDKGCKVVLYLKTPNMISKKSRCPRIPS